MLLLLIKRVLDAQEQLAIERTNNSEPLLKCPRTRRFYECLLSSGRAIPPVWVTSLEYGAV